MFGRKQRIIETQKALIMDLQQYHNDLVEQNVRLRKENERLSRTIVAMQTAKIGINIDFPNSHEGSKTNTGAVNVSDILQN
ncbi:MAG: hypothetical protein J6S67_26700 [Methanobrevibacter sp.]|nr:hypothetical protein [Methanobrevibacter sp.]MBO7736189.1 hypothetical protein [Methanobrevibacter sp.]